MKNLVEVRYEHSNGDLHSAKGGNFDAAFRNVRQINGAKILIKVGRKSPMMFVAMCAKVGTTVNVIIKNGSNVYESGQQPEPKEEPLKKEPQPEPKEEPLKKEPKKDVSGIERKDIPELKPKNDAPIDTSNPFGVFAELMKPYLKQSEINQDQINSMIDSALTKHSKTIVIQKIDGTKKKIDKQHFMFEDLLNNTLNRENSLLVGAAGSGKTYATSKVAEVLDLPFYAISVGAMTTKTDFLGYMDANGNYSPTTLRKAVEFGGIYLIDEIDAGNANVLTTLNMMLGSEFASFPDGMVEVHKDFVVIACANTFGNGADRMYVGRNQLDAASLDRFLVVKWDYDYELEMLIASNQRWTRYVQSCRQNMFRAKLRFVISPRASISGGKLIDSGVSVDKCKEMVLFKSLSEADIKTVTNGVTY